MGSVRKMEDILPLPYAHEVDVVRGQFVLLLRLTPKGQYCTESINDFLTENEQILDKWVYGIEHPDDVNKLHYHFVIYTTVQIEDFRKLVKEFISPYFPEKKRGYGNAQYNLQLADDPRKAITYALKDLGDSNFSGFTEECIEHLKGESFPKLTFDGQVINLNKKYIDTNMADYEYLAEYYKIYSNFGRSINPQTIHGYLLSIKVKKDPEYAITYAIKFLNRQLS